MTSSARPRILITGADGQLGWELQRTFAPLGEIVALDRNGLDLTSADAIRERCSEIAPALILNAAAYTAVDKAESEQEVAMSINGIAPGILAEEANRFDVPLIHYSTDYVFDGKATQPYRESDATAPQSVYGRTKLAGEVAVAATAKRHLILRTSWLYGNRRQNFFLTMLRLAKERDELRVVADQIGSPTWVHSVSRHSSRCVSIEGNRLELTIPPGIYHLTAAGSTSWHGFASAILASVPVEERRATRVVPLTTAEYPTPARRPEFSVLSVEKIEHALTVTIDDWQQQLAQCFAERNQARL
ncbi:MAG: dTDP-4-dehydrorhamnose reductase [Betaproteobacteria bacterium]|nr:dTDP-4-dehydrorhamnose reductase [Betaproteobacteria bacterium]